MTPPRPPPTPRATPATHDPRASAPALVLGIESSCDETAVALVADGRHVLAERVASQIDLHARFGGVIPELASRSHLEVLFPLVEETLAAAGVPLHGMGAPDALAVTHTPGLVGCLLVGLSAAKGLSLSTGLPLVGVNHVHAHVYGALMPHLAEGTGNPSVDIEWPLASLVVSGGHTSLYESRSPTEHRRVGRTLDDAAGEAYDKVAAVLGLGYPGGPVVDKLAATGDPAAHAFPRSKGQGLDFSFSGLKTAVLYACKGGADGNFSQSLLPGVAPADVAASFQAAVVDVLVDRLERCADELGARGLVICGGVAANSALRVRAAELAERLGLPLYRPPMRLATDNAVMIAGLGHHLLAAGVRHDLSLDAVPRAD